MLIQFTVENYLSFNKPVSLSMLSSSITEHKSTHTFQLGDYELLKTASVYGPNASGKTNLFKALSFMRRFVLDSSKESRSDEEIGIDRFRLNTESENKPSVFEVVFYVNNSAFRYGFSVEPKRVKEEWLFKHRNKNDEIELFYRLNNEIEASSEFFKEGYEFLKFLKNIENSTDNEPQSIRENALFLSVLAQFLGKKSLSAHIQSWFDNLIVISAESDFSLQTLLASTIEKLDQPLFKKQLLKLAKTTDLGIVDFKQGKLSEDILPEELPSEIKKEILEMDILLSGHTKYDAENNPIGSVYFHAQSDESAGTIKTLSLASPIIQTLENGGILFIDELDARLHTLITKSIFNLFNNPTTNPNNAQLIASTHDTNHLSNKSFRRDQIWFVEKNEYGCSKLFSLVEYKLESNEKVRKDASYEKDYLLGRYGAVPIIGSLKDFWED